MISDADLNHSNILSSAQETTLLTARPPPSGLKTSRWHWRQPGGAHTCTLTHVFFSFSSPFPSSLYFPSSTYFSCTFRCLSSSKSLHHHLTFFSPNDGYTQFTWDTSRALIWCMVTNIAMELNPLLVLFFTPVCFLLWKVKMSSVNRVYFTYFTYFTHLPLSSVCQLALCGWIPTLCLTPVCRSLVTKTAAPAPMEDRR